MKKIAHNSSDIIHGVFFVVVFAALLTLLSISVVLMSGVLWGAFGGYLTMLVIAAIGYVYVIKST